MVDVRVALSEENDRLIDENTRLRAALEEIANLIPHGTKDYSHRVFNIARAALAGSQEDGE